MTRALLSAVALLALAAYACDLNGLPPDLTALAGFGAVALVVGIGAFAIGRWGRG